MAQRPSLAQRSRASASQRPRGATTDENVAPPSSSASAALQAAIAVGNGKSVLAGGAQRVVRVPLGQKVLSENAGNGGVKAGVVGRKALGDVSNKERVGRVGQENGKKAHADSKEGRQRSSTVTAPSHGPTRAALRPVSNVLPARSARPASVANPKDAPRSITLPLPGAYGDAAFGIARDPSSEDEPALEEDMMDLDDEEATPIAEMPTSRSEPMFGSEIFTSDRGHTPQAFVPSSDPEEAVERAVVARQLSPASTSPVPAEHARPETRHDILYDEPEGSELEEEEEEEVETEDWVTLPSKEHQAVMAELDRVRKLVEDEVDPLDTTMVAEYAEEIFEYMNELEASVMPSANYMIAQSEIEWDMRTTLVDWLLQVHLRYHMLPETLWIAINIVDRFLSLRIVSLVKLQLVGVTAMFVAAKYEEIIAPSVDEFVFMTENGYTKEEILKGERIILQALDFKISNYCSPYSWVRRISKADDYDIHTRTLCKFLMEVTLLDERFLRAKPSMIAAVGMYVARRMLGGEWDDLFIFYSNYTELQLLPGARFIIERLLGKDFEKYYVYKKYATKRFLKASVFARDWARKHGAEMSVPLGNSGRAMGVDSDGEGA